MTDIPKTYEPKEVERKWYSFWMEKGYFHADDVSDKPPYCIVIPPPNVTGVLHKGHAVPMTLQDILIRWKRMQGNNTLWMPGTNHAGIFANAVVEWRASYNSLKPDEVTILKNGMIDSVKWTSGHWQKKFTKSGRNQDEYYGYKTGG